MKRFWAIFCSVTLLAAVMLAAFPAVLAEAADTFTDDMTDLTKVNQTVGEWDVFPNHPELGLSVAGRKTTDAENSLVYSFADKTIEAVSIRVAEYTGFLAKGDLTSAVKVGDSWVDLALTQSAESDITGKEDSSFKWVTFTADAVPENATGLKVTLNNGVAWTLLIDEISVGLAEAESGEDDSFTLTDPYDTLDVATSASDNLVLNTPHAETQLNVVGRKGTVGESSLTYKKTGYRIGNFALKVQYAPDWTTLDTDLLISVRKANTNEWTALALTISEPTAIPNSSTDVFKSAVVTTTDVLPEDAVELKVEMANGVIWTMFLDELSIDFLVSDLTDDPAQEPEGPDKPDIAFNFSELFESMDAIPEKSGNWELFAPHPETGLNVIGKTNNIKGTLTYKAEDGKVIDNFALKLQIAPAFFNPDAELLFQVRRAGSEEWETVALTVGYLQNINASFSTCWVQPEAALGDNVTEIRFGFYNSVAWTLMVNELHLNYALASADNPGEPETPDGPEAGAQAATAAVLLTALSGAAVVLFRRKKA